MSSAHPRTALLVALQRLALLVAFAVGGSPAPAVPSLARRRRKATRRHAAPPAPQKHAA